MSPTHAIIALKSPRTAKSRLQPVLNPEQRRVLFYAMAEQMLAALQALPGIVGLHVVTPCAEVARRMLGDRVNIIRENGACGLNGAFEFAQAQLPSAGHRVLMLPGDLPLVSAAAITSLLQYQTAPVVIVPDRRHSGTNALLLGAGVRLPLQFGPGSLQRHLRVAHALGLATQVAEIAALGLDIDEPADLEEMGRHALMHLPAAPPVPEWQHATV